MRRLVVLTGSVATVALLAVSPALAHEHPSGITDLVTPAVVRVEAVARVDITLLDHIGELVHVERSYEVPIGVGTGVVVNSEGGIVTLTRVVQSEQDVAVYAANKIFAEHHKVKIPLDFNEHEVKDDQLNHHLEACYPPKKPTATCIINVKSDITIFPNIATPDDKGFKAELVQAGATPDSPAVLLPVDKGDGGAGMPTAPLAEKVPDKPGSPVALAGFLGRPSATVRHKVDIGHLGKGGAGSAGRGFTDPYNKVDEPAKLGKLADGGMLSAPVIENTSGHVVGLLIGGGKDARMIGVREITSALQKAKVLPRRGTIDAAFEAALTRFHTKYYTEAASHFQRVLDLYPGHVVAAEHLKTSLAKRGTAEDEGTKKAAVSTVAGTPLWPFIAAAAVLLVAALTGAFLLWRRRSTPPPEDRSTQPPAQSPTLPPALVSGPPAAPFDDRANPTVVVRRSQTFQAMSQPVITDTPSIKHCTACGLRLGTAHRFCGYCGHPNET